MKKIIKALLYLVATVLVLAVALVIALPLIFDPNDHKQTITDAIKSTIGREVRLDGEIEWSVFPSIALSIKDVKLLNDIGFPNQYMAEMGELSAQVKVLPLLKKDIKIGTVTLNQPDIHLAVSADGKSNWQSIVDALGAEDGSSSGPATTAEQTGSTPAIEVRGISIINGQVTYEDQGAGLSVALSDVNFKTNQIALNHDSDIDISAHVAMPNEGLHGTFESQVVAQNLLNGNGIKLLFKTLQFEGKLSSASKLPLVLASESGGVLDLGQDRLSFDQLSASLGQLKVSTGLDGKNISSNMSFSGDLSLNQFDVDEFLADLGAPLVNEAENVLSGHLKWHFMGNSVSISDLSVNLDEYAMTGAFDIADLANLQGEFNLAMDAFDADPYMPQSEATASSESTSSDSGMAALDFGHLNGHIDIGKLSFAGLSLDNITLKLATNGTDFTVQPLQADFYQGLIKTELQLKPQQQNNRLQLSHNMSDIHAGTMLTDLMGSEFMNGLGQLNADLYIDEPFSERPFKTAHGSIQYRLTDGDIVGIDVFDIIQRSLTLLGDRDIPPQNTDLKTEFGLMELDATVEQGVLKTNTLRLTSPYFEVDGKVTIDLDAQTIKGSIKPMLTNIPEGMLGEEFKKLLNLRIPVALSGSLLEPNIKIDVKELIIGSQKDKIEEKKQELKEDLFNKLLGNDKEKKRNQQSGDHSKNQQEGQATTSAEESELTEKQKRRQHKKAQQRALLEGLLGGSKKKEEKENQEDGDNDNGN